MDSLFQQLNDYSRQYGCRSRYVPDKQFQDVVVPQRVVPHVRFYPSALIRQCVDPSTPSRRGGFQLHDDERMVVSKHSHGPRRCAGGLERQAVPHSKSVNLAGRVQLVSSQHLNPGEPGSQV